MTLERAEWLPLSAQETYQQLQVSINAIGSQVERGRAFSPQHCVRILDQLLDYPPEFINDLHGLTLSPSRQKENLGRHAVHVAINSLLMGKAMGFNRAQKLELATAALLHELGMYRIPPAIRDKTDPLSPEESAIIREHPLITASLLLNCGMSWLNTAMITQQEHERSDGSGYPRGLRGDGILVSASIIGILDSYEALINSRPHRNRLTAAEATLTIVRQGKHLFHPQVIRQFFTLYSLYPINSYIRLNNGAVAVVTRVNPLFPMKPMVRLLTDANWNPVARESAPVDLSKSSLLYILQVLNEEEVKERLGQDDTGRYLMA